MPQSNSKFENQITFAWFRPILHSKRYEMCVFRWKIINPKWDFSKGNNYFQQNNNLYFFVRLKSSVQVHIFALFMVAIEFVWMNLKFNLVCCGYKSAGCKLQFMIPIQLRIYWIRSVVGLCTSDHWLCLFVCFFSLLHWFVYFWCHTKPIT